MLKALYQTLFRILNRNPGDDAHDRKVLIMAPMGKAAFNVKGSTIHSAFKVPANQSLNTYEKLSFSLLNKLCLKYRHLKWIFCNEISMVSNKIWKYIHLRLQDIKQNQLPFGGVNIVAIGDFYQLQPVKSHFVFQKLSNDYSAFAENLWTEYFTIYELDQIMRQQDDASFAHLLNRLRTNKHTQEDIQKLETCLMSNIHPQPDNIDSIPHFFPT